VLTKLICWLFGHKTMVKASTGNTFQTVNQATGLPQTGHYYRWERKPFCVRCGTKVHNPEEGPVQVSAGSSGPMTRTQYLLVTLVEEFCEAGQRATKALRFGMNEVQPGHADDNVRRLERELADAVAVAEMLNLKIREEDKAAKREKVEKYMVYSRQMGVLEAEKASPDPSGCPVADCPVHGSQSPCPVADCPIHGSPK
jgi:hypothetical protein